MNRKENQPGILQIFRSSFNDCYQQQVSGGEAVILNVYSITKLNKLFTWFGFGLYHTGLQVYGKEYSYGGHDHDSSGIMMSEPHSISGVVLYESFIIGFTRHSQDQIDQQAIYMSEIWKGKDYDPFNNNCNHFTKAMLQRILVHPGRGYLAVGDQGVQQFFYPPYINRFTGLAPLLRHWFEPLKRLYGNVVTFQEGPATGAAGAGQQNASDSSNLRQRIQMDHNFEEKKYNGGDSRNFNKNLSQNEFKSSGLQMMFQQQNDNDLNVAPQNKDQQSLIFQAIIEKDTAQANYMAGFYHKSIQHSRLALKYLENLGQEYQIHNLQNFLEQQKQEEQEEDDEEKQNFKDQNYQENKHLEDQQQQSKEQSPQDAKKKTHLHRKSKILQLMKIIFQIMINCYWNISKMRNVIYFCNALLSIEDENVKALVKRAQANMYQGQLDKAYSDIVRAKQVDPQNVLIEEEFKKVLNKIQAAKSEDSKHYQK